MDQAIVRSTGLLLQALQYAAAKHRDQRRKNEGKTPYINHPIDVLHLLWFEAGVRETEILIAALLHDTVEDTDATFEEIASLFGNGVRNIVAEVTDDKQIAWTDRKAHQISTAPHLSKAAKLVRLADKISNLSDILRDPPENWSVKRQTAYFAWAKKVIDGMRGTHAGLEHKFDTIQKDFFDKYQP